MRRLIAFLLGFTLMWGVIGTRAALSHEWYPNECCSGQDCHPVPCNEIHLIANEWVYKSSHFAKSEARSSPDGTCHVCISSWGKPYCLFLGGVS
jgi:hypothetical protein